MYAASFEDASQGGEADLGDQRVVELAPRDLDEVERRGVETQNVLRGVSPASVLVSMS